jgi:hypothetical protein
MYLKPKSVPMTTQDSVLQIPVAKLEFQTIQDHHNLIQDHLSECLQIYGFWSKDVRSDITRGITNSPSLSRSEDCFVTNGTK